MKKRIAKYAYEYGLIALGTLALGLGLNLFLTPLNLSAGGVTTLGTVILHFTKIPISVTNLLANIVLFGLSFKFLGKESVIKTVAGVLFLSLFLEITRYLPPIMADNQDFLLAAICGGVLLGIGLGLVIRPGGSTGGSDLMGLLIKRFMQHVPVAMLILAVDMAFITIAGLVFRSIEITFYSAVATFITAKVADFIANLGDAAKSIYIVSEKSEEIADLVMSKLDRGVTKIHSRGGYSGKERPMLLCVVAPKQAPVLVKDVKRIDPSAFIVICDAREVLGEGFKSK